MRKNFLRTFLSALLICSMLPVTAYAETAVVTGRDVNLRSGPGMDYGVVDTLQQGSSVTVQDRSSSDWYAVTYEGNYGFVSANLVSLTADTPVKVVPTNGSGRINAMYVRFRSGPSSNSDVLGEYNVGKELTITGSAGDWVECFIDGQTGYVHSDFVDVESNGAVVIVDTPRQAAVSDLVTPDPVAKSAPASPAAVQDLVTPDPSAAAPAATPAPAPDEPPAAEAAGFIDGDYVCFRVAPSTSAAILNTYNRGKELVYTGSSNGWTTCTIDGQTGYVSSKYVKPADAQPKPLTASTLLVTPDTAPAAAKGTAGYISGSYVHFRASADYGEILGDLYYGQELTITGTVGEWTAVVVDGQAGYVHKSLVSKGSPKPAQTEAAVTPLASGQKITGRDIADFALQYVGYNYRWGGMSPDTGFDCSGFTSYVYKQFGFELNRVACDQAVNGRHVDNDKLQPGDILCFYSGGSYIGHVGIYIGDNMFVHAANSSSGVITSSLSGYYATRGFTARRIV